MQGRIVGAGTLLIEQKFIRSTGFAGHLEDVVVDSAIRGTLQQCAPAAQTPP